MKILIVDDQVSVVQGIKAGINWGELGIDEVYTAYNALEAKKILTTRFINLMLCDIEMPAENGLQLYEWICSQGIQIQCIFLTSHAEFDYAKKAIKLGAFDYIIQPAPYEKIKEVVSRAIKVIKDQQAKNKIFNKGKIFREQEISIASNILREYLSGASNQNEMNTMSKLKLLPDFLDEGCVILIQIVKWYDESEKWEHNLLESAFENILSEVFNNFKYIIGLSYMGEDTIALVIQYKTGQLNIEKDILFKLDYFNSICKKYFKCGVACYYSDSINLSKTKDVWDKLIEERDCNIRLKSGVFSIEENTSNRKREYNYKNPQIKYWQTLIMDGYSDAMEQQATIYLDKKDADGTLDKISLLNFYQDFVYMIHTIIRSDNTMCDDIFATGEGLELYLNGMKSINSMKRLINFVTINFRTENHIDNSKLIINKALKYIGEHLEDDIKRDDLAEHVHLSPDYLSRIFKKEMGITLKEYIIKQKMLAAQVLLQTTKLPVSYIAAKMGYSNFSHFSSTFKRIFAHSPNEERAE